ncbi:PucR family transcriptional regulator ligand-binding domain-containing protein [Halobacillus litoralis]|uniref:PucR family transcriptional regulator n=1 Tax=Halobacillus litoralis TaxID=45668 RepID=UPI001CD1CAB1|nr:PucR family transcriptional regulator [Halobacillus litoralis]MCA0971263.1 PucR family transcriptional regulator ligand-binding domain-containing protein [Halobacillus litoralis]
MAVRVNDVMDLPVLQKAKRLTEAYNNEIQWVSVMEAPVEHYVRNQEFVLSTGMGCGEDPQALEEYVRDVIESGASALAFATGRYLYQIPEPIIQLADSRGMVLLELPWEIRFGDVLQEVLQMITKSKESEQKRTDQIRQTLINCVLNGEGLNEITSILYKETGIPVAISDQHKRVRANHAFDRFLIDVLNGKESGVVSTTTVHPFSEHPLFHFIEKYMVDSSSCYQLTITSNYKKQGYLLFQPETEGELTWFTLTVLEHGLTACALYFVKENAIEMTEIRLKDNFLLDLARTDQPVDASKARLLGYDLDRSYMCLVGHIHPTVESPGFSSSDEGQTSSMHSRNYYVQKELTRAGDVLKNKVMATFDDQEVIVFLEGSPDSQEEKANQFLDLVERRLHDLLADHSITWGVSSLDERSTPFHQRYKEASAAWRIGRQQTEASRTFFYHTKMNRVLMALSMEGEIDQIVEETLSRLVDYDTKRQTDLIHTFMVYNKHNSNVSKAARELNLHRQSLLHRLRNIEQLTGLSLLNADDLFLLELCVRLWKLKQI